MLCDMLDVEIKVLPACVPAAQSTAVIPVRLTPHECQIQRCHLCLVPLPDLLWVLAANFTGIADLYGPDLLHSRQHGHAELYSKTPYLPSKYRAGRLHAPYESASAYTSSA